MLTKAGQVRLSGVFCNLRPFPETVRTASLTLCWALPRGRIGGVHLRTPSTAKGVQSFVWAVVIFLFLYFGMVAIAVSKGTAFVIALVSGFFVFLLVRTRGGDSPLDRG